MSLEPKRLWFIWMVHVAYALESTTTDIRVRNVLDAYVGYTHTNLNSVFLSVLRTLLFFCIKWITLCNSDITKINSFRHEFTCAHLNVYENVVNDYLENSEEALTLSALSLSLKIFCILPQERRTTNDSMPSNLCSIVFFDKR